MATDFLNKIVEHKRQEIEAAKSRISEHDLMEQALAADQHRRPFFKTLASPGNSGVNIIAEIKRASPSKGPIRPDLDAAHYATSYQRGGAACISVLTESAYFKGSFEDFRVVRNASTLPMLRKDFLISSYQIYESALLGADAVLLIAKILSKQQLKDYLKLCAELKLDVLTEVHSEQEIEIATEAGAKLIGINNRNLRTFETSLDTCVRMSELLMPHQIAVAESGIRTREDIVKLKQAGIFNFLIGESIVRAENPETFLQSLMI
ncbi:MAG: indole-3-glycerol phosphate synthase TrpC [Desulfobacteraceae bacterium]|nr:indole-3-glycerol phosphate synthase TrpC [Desulfobacteraceae bacterium]